MTSTNDHKIMNYNYITVKHNIFFKRERGVFQIFDL